MFYKFVFEGHSNSSDTVSSYWERTIIPLTEDLVAAQAEAWAEAAKSISPNASACTLHLRGVQPIIAKHDVETLRDFVADKEAVKEAMRKPTQLEQVRAILERCVCTVEPDKGVVLLSSEAPMTRDKDGRNVYQLMYFSPLGEALIEAWHATLPPETTEQESDVQATPRGESDS